MASSHEKKVPGRLVPELPLPPYAFVPGRYPHPNSDPAGHSYGTTPDRPARLTPADWWTSRPYLFGFDLFNAGYYWESHVEWEGLWLACGRTGLVADFLKGLIQLAAAGVKHREGVHAGVRSHARRAAELWRGTAESLPSREESFLGFRLRELVVLAEAVCRDGWSDGSVFLLPALPPG